MRDGTSLLDHILDRDLLFSPPPPLLKCISVSCAGSQSWTLCGPVCRQGDNTVGIADKGVGILAFLLLFRMILVRSRLG